MGQKKLGICRKKGAKSRLIRRRRRATQASVFTTRVTPKESMELPISLAVCGVSIYPTRDSRTSAIQSAGHEAVQKRPPGNPALPGAKRRRVEGGGPRIKAAELQEELFSPFAAMRHKTRRVTTYLASLIATALTKEFVEERGYSDDELPVVDRSRLP